MSSKIFGTLYLLFIVTFSVIFQHFFLNFTFHFVSCYRCRRMQTTMLRGKCYSWLRQVLSKKEFLKRRAKGWTPLENGDAATNFHLLNEDYIRYLTFGVYQVKQAFHYIDEYLTGGKSRILVCSASSDLAHGLLRSLAGIVNIRPELETLDAVHTFT